MTRTLTAVFSFLLLTLTTPPVFPCHVPEELANTPGLTPEQIALLSHGHSPLTQIPYVLTAAAPCVSGMADIFPCSNVDLLAHLPLSAIGGGSGSDIWGWEDPMTGKEYALLGRSNGTAFIDISDPENPKYLGNLPTHSQASAWRDIKTYQGYAFIVADHAFTHGLQVFDLARLRNVVNPPVVFTEDAHYSGFDRSHNLVINEASGFGYAVGSETCSGGLHMIDLHDPLNPSFAGCFGEDGYTHDAQCLTYAGPDGDYQGREVCVASNTDSITLVDVTNKSLPTLISRTEYAGSGFTHQGWLTEDQAYFVLDDENDEPIFGHNTRTYAWDMRNLDDPSIVGIFTAAGTSRDHNQFVRGDYTYQANYRRGLRILSVADIAHGNLAEVAFIDTFPEADGNNFDGAWTAYPYYDSGVVVVSDINRGLFIVRPHLPSGVLFADGFESGNVNAWNAAVP